MTTPAPNKGQTYPAEVLTQGEVTSLLALCSSRAPSGIRNRALLTLLYRSGLRISEALALRPSDINLDTHEIRVLHGKGNKATTRGFHPSAADALLRWMDTRKARGIKRGAPLFCTLNGGAMDAEYVRQVLHRLGDRAGIEKRCHPHGLRHTFAVELEMAGTPVTVISKLLGHSSVAVTARYLDHLTSGQAISILESVHLPELGA
jgi:site-specific recombinase XerD